MATAEPKAAERTGHAGRITALAVGFEDPPPVWSGGADGEILEWDLGSGRARALPTSEKAPVVGLAAYRDTVISAHADGTLVLHGPSEERHALGAEPLALAYDGHALYVALREEVRRLTVPGFEGKTELAGAVRSLDAFNGRGVVGVEQGSVATLFGGETIWSVLGTEREPVTAVAVLGTEVIAGGADGTVRVSVHGAQESEAIAGGAPVTALDAVHFGDERVVASGHEDGTLQVVFGDKQRSVTFETGPEPVAPLALADVDGRHVALTGGSDGGLRQWELDAGTPGSQSDKVEWLSDAPADEDLLRRRPLAKALARRLERIRAGEPGRSFLIHVDGAWGTGKSTIMGYLGAELADRWLVVDFNAWRRSRVGPPWWALLVALRAEVARNRGPFGRFRLRVAEAFSQARRTGTRYLLALAVAAAVAAAIYLVLSPRDTASIGDTARSIAAVMAGIGTLWAAGTVVARMMLWDSAKGARVYEQAESDPMEHVADHFGWLARRAGRPILFFVDDLDRCPGDYVVELLEAVQTLVRDAATDENGTYFVIAADGSWVRTSYEQRYADFAGTVGEPGRPLGYLFLDKLFQLTVRVPAVSALDQAHYLAGLLAVHRDAPDVRAEVAVAEQRLEAGNTDAEVVAVLEKASPAAREVLRETAIERLSDASVQAATDHSLERFAGLLEPNPRAMKRFVNAFGLARVVLTLEDVLVPFDVLALWTILSTRWPMLADRLREHPEEIELVGTKAAGVPEDVRVLLASREVAEVVRFPNGGPLTRELIENCVTGRSATAAPAR
jgi:WD40 repeat protein